LEKIQREQSGFLEKSTYASMTVQVGEFVLIEFVQVGDLDVKPYKLNFKGLFENVDKWNSY
jgi:hypothetical protein